MLFHRRQTALSLLFTCLQTLALVISGIRSTVHLAPSAFLASAAGYAELVQAILPPRLQSLLNLLYVSRRPSNFGVRATSTPLHFHHPHTNSRLGHTMPRVEATYRSLLDSATDSQIKACLLAVKCRETGAWLRALPVASLGLRLDDEAVCIAVGLRLGLPLC